MKLTLLDAMCKITEAFDMVEPVTVKLMLINIYTVKKMDAWMLISKHFPWLR
jgi:hypothetical protein